MVEHITKLSNQAIEVDGEILPPDDVAAEGVDLRQIPDVNFIAGSIHASRHRPRLNEIDEAPDTLADESANEASEEDPFEARAAEELLSVSIRHLMNEALEGAYKSKSERLLILDQGEHIPLATFLEAQLERAKLPDEEKERIRVMYTDMIDNYDPNGKVGPIQAYRNRKKQAKKQAKKSSVGAVGSSGTERARRPDARELAAGDYDRSDLDR